jgi:hypothetical protein
MSGLYARYKATDPTLTDGQTQPNLAVTSKGGLITSLRGTVSTEGDTAFRLNTEGTLLASAARTATVTTATQTNHNARGVFLFLRVTAASGTGGVRARIEWVDPLGSAKTLHAVPAYVTVVGTYTYLLYPGSPAGASELNSSTPLPRTWRVIVDHGDATSYTYSLGYALIL